MQATIMSEDADPVIELDEQGVELLRALAGHRSRFRVRMRPDGSISLHPMSDHDAELWRSGLVSQIVDSFSHADRMIRLKPDKL
jgi:predicted RNA polymerase sigma factor